MSTVIFAILYLLVPFAIYRLVFSLTASNPPSWIAAVISVPVGIVTYVRLFEWVKKRGFSKKV